MSKFKLNYDIDEINQILDKVIRYNELPIDRRRDNHHVANQLVGGGIRIAADGEFDPDITSDLATGSEFLLEVVPVWCNDQKLLESGSSEEKLNAYNTYYGDSADEALFHYSDLKLVICEHKYGKGIYKYYSLGDFGDEIASRIARDFN